MLRVISSGLTRSFHIGQPIATRPRGKANLECTFLGVLAASAEETWRLDSEIANFLFATIQETVSVLGFHFLLYLLGCFFLFLAAFFSSDVIAFFFAFSDSKYSNIGRKSQEPKLSILTLFR